MSSNKIHVWDPLVRLLHWTLATSTTIAFFTHKGPEWLHFLSGYTALAVAIIRIFVGFTGSHYARFKEFVTGPRTALSYVTDLIKNREKHFIGHNPLGGYMILLLLMSVLISGTAGSLLNTDRLFGDEFVEDIHTFFSYLIVPLVALHICGVVFTSIRQRENLVVAMITGEKTNIQS